MSYPALDEKRRDELRSLRKLPEKWFEPSLRRKSERGAAHGHTPTALFVNDLHRLISATSNGWTQPLLNAVAARIYFTS
jgi:hypothetical protein